MTGITETRGPAATGGRRADSGASLALAWRWMLARGILALLLAAAALSFPVEAVFAFTLILSAFAGADGLVSFIAGVGGAAARDKRSLWLLLRGLVGIAVALLFAILPVLATLTYALVGVSLLAAWLIVAGMLEVVAAIRLRKTIKGEWLLGASGAFSVAMGLLVWGVSWTWPLSSLLSVGWMIAAWALLSSVALVTLALRLKRLRSRAERVIPEP